MIRPIALLTDFGSQDIFVGVLKGVILSVNPWASVTDLGHGVPPQDIGAGAFFLSTAYSYFPQGTIFCTVVDPGVGSERRAVAVETEHYHFVGPDNGVLFPAAEADGIKTVVELNRDGFFLDSVSNTFHGRDIFAPVAAHLSLARDILDLGDEIKASGLTSLAFPAPSSVEGGVRLSILHVDIYGNLTLNLTRKEFDQYCGNGFSISVGGYNIQRFHPAYAHGSDDTPFVLEASSGYMEIAVKNQSAARILGLGTRDDLIMKLDTVLS